MRNDFVLKGVLIAFGSFAAFSFSDASVKLIEGRIPPYESAFFGALLSLLALPFLKKRTDRWLDTVRSVNRPLWLLRFVCSAIGAITSVTAFTHLSMAEAFSLIFLLPSFVTIMSVIFLKEEVGIRRWSAVILGFIGVLVVLRPGFRELGIGHVAALVAGLAAAINIVIMRGIGPAEKSISLFGAGSLGALIICAGVMAPTFTMPGGHEWLLLLGYGILGALGNVLLMYATFYAPAAVVSPIQYSQMIWAIILGYLIFGDGVDAPMLLGIGLIVGSGLITLVRERKRGVAMPPPVAPNTQAAVAISDDALTNPDDRTATSAAPPAGS